MWRKRVKCSKYSMFDKSKVSNLNEDFYFAYKLPFSMHFVLFSKHIYVCERKIFYIHKNMRATHKWFFPEKWDIHGSALWKGIKPNKNTMWKVLKHVFFRRRRRGNVQWVGLKCFLRKLHFIKLWFYVIVNTVWSFNNGAVRDTPATRQEPALAGFG